MYTDKIKTQDEAICQLFFHCCMKDGRFTETEIDTVSELLVKLGFKNNSTSKTRSSNTFPTIPASPAMPNTFATWCFSSTLPTPSPSSLTARSSVSAMPNSVPRKSPFLPPSPLRSTSAPPNRKRSRNYVLSERLSRSSICGEY